MDTANWILVVVFGFCLVVGFGLAMTNDLGRLYRALAMVLN